MAKLLMCWGNYPRPVDQYCVPGPIITDVSIFCLSVFSYIMALGKTHLPFFSSPVLLYCLTLKGLDLFLGFSNSMAMEQMKMISKHDSKTSGK